MDAGGIRFSVIVPVYKVEKYMRACVDSVLGQSFKNLELILVDDGSPDNCGRICDEMKRRDGRITVIHKKNGGLSSARNAGIAAAKGEYMIFLDSDDFWDDYRALANIHIRLTETEADLLIFPAKRYYEADNLYTDILSVKVDRGRVTDTDKKKAIYYLVEHNIYKAAAWNKAVRRQLIEEQGMRFREGYLSEDMDWCGDLLLYAKRFDFYEIPFYCYRQQREGSITKEKKEKLVADKLYMCKKGFEQAGRLDEEMKLLLASYYAYEYSVLLGVSAGVRDKKLLARLRELKGLLDYDVCNKVKKVNKLRRTVGYELTRKALCLFVRLKK